MEILSSILTSPVLVAFITCICSVAGNYLVTKKDFLRLQILTLLQEERIAKLENKEYINATEILDLYDKYVKLGGNSYIKSIIERYKKENNL